MNPKQIAKDTARILQSYLTYQAVKTIVNQLSETNPPEAIWLSRYSSGQLEDGEAYIQGLMLERKDLVMRILAVREHLAETMLDFLPEMVKTGISQSNTEHRRQLLERLTQTQESERESDLDNPKLQDE
jgi:RbcX protein